MENYRNKMLRILSGIAAAGRCFNRFFTRKKGHEFSILHSQFLRAFVRPDMSFVRFA